MPNRRFEVVLQREHKTLSTARLTIMAENEEEAKRQALTDAAANGGRNVSWQNNGLNQQGTPVVDEVNDLGVPWTERDATNKREAIIDYMTRQNVTTARTTYSVANGRVRYDSWTFEGPGAPALNALAAANGHVNIAGLEEPIRHFFNDTVQSGLDRIHAGWLAAPHGGRGTAVFSVAESRLKLEHVTYTRQEEASADAV